jgi:hypothetical protein
MESAAGKLITTGTGRQYWVTNGTGYWKNWKLRRRDTENGLNEENGSGQKHLDTSGQPLHNKTNILINNQPLANTNIVTNTTKSNCGTLVRHSLQDAASLVDANLARPCTGETTSDSKLNKSGNTDALFPARPTTLTLRSLKRLLMLLSLYAVVVLSSEHA